MPALTLQPPKYTKLHSKAIAYMYRWLVGNLRLRSAISNVSSVSKIHEDRHGETRTFLIWIFVYVLSSRSCNVIKFIAADMDGTLIDSRHEISAENCHMIKKAQQQNIRFAIATGRLYDDVKVLLDKYGLECECITMNGAEYFNTAGECTAGIYIEKEKARKIFSMMLQTKKFSIEIYTNKGCYTYSSKFQLFCGMIKRARIYHAKFNMMQIFLYLCHNPHFHRMQYIKDINTFMDSDIKIAKFVSFGDNAEEMSVFRKQMEKIDGIAVSASFATNIEINDAAATKGAILKRIAKDAGIKSDEVMVIGDGLNDITMFEEFPVHSAGMGNAVQEIKAIASFVTNDNNNSGVGTAIKKALTI